MVYINIIIEGGGQNVIFFYSHYKKRTINHMQGIIKVCISLRVVLHDPIFMFEILIFLSRGIEFHLKIEIYNFSLNKVIGTCFFYKNTENLSEPQIFLTSGFYFSKFLPYPLPLRRDLNRILTTDYKH